MRRRERGKTIMKKVETKEFDSESSDMRPIKCRKKIKSEEEKEKGENFPKMEVCYLPQSPPKDEFYTTNMNMVKEEVDDEDYNSSTSTPRDDDYIHFPFTNYKFVKEHFDGMYNILRSIHLGSSAHVLLCFYRLQTCDCILKVFHRTKMFSEKASKEINLLQMLAKHDHTGQHFVRMITWFKHSNHTCIVLDLLGLNLRKYLVEHTSRPKFSIDDIYQLGRQMLESVALMHDLHLIHTDLKPQHLLFASPEYIPSSQKNSLGDYALNYNKRFPRPFALKLIDFTSTIHHNDNEYHSDIVSTRQYRAPEVILGLGWSYPCDVWSVGCILAELYAEKILFDQTNDDDLQHLAMMERVLGKFPSHMLEKTLHPVGKYFEDGKLDLPKSLTKEVMGLSPVQKLVRSHVSGNEADFINLLQGLLKCDPSERLTARDALRHPFFMEREIPDDPERVRAARHYANSYKGFKTFPRYH